MAGSHRGRAECRKELGRWPPGGSQGGSRWSLAGSRSPAAQTHRRPAGGQASTHHTHPLFCEDSIVEVKARWPRGRPPPCLPAPRTQQTPAFNRARKNRLSSPNLSAEFPQRRSENRPRCIASFTECASSLPQPVKVSWLVPAPEATAKAKAEGGRNPKLVQPVLPPGASPEQSPCEPSPMLDAGCPRVRKLVRGPKAHVTY